MNHYSFTSRDWLILVTLSLLSLLLLLIYQGGIEKEPRPEYPLMREAALRTHDAIKKITDYRRQLGLAVDPVLDPNLTGLIGVEFSPLTTTLGNLEAKQTALNPDFAALLVRWLSELGLQENDRVALQLSGSFPLLNIAAIIACDVMNLQPQISSSPAASSYGANLPELTYLDMENLLWESGIIHHRSVVVTYGGEEDSGEGLWEGGAAAIREAAGRNHYELMEFPHLGESISFKMQFFQQRGPVKAFINSGGNHSALGNCPHGSAFPPGLVTSPIQCRHRQPGTLLLFRQQQIPVIHLLDIRSLALKYDIALAPFPLPPAGSSDLYYTIRRPQLLPVLAALLLAASWLLWGIFRRHSPFT